MRFFFARVIHLAYLLGLTGLFWLAVRGAWKRRGRVTPPVAFVGAAALLLIVIWFFVYPPARGVIGRIR